eukprot:997972-Pelagomonas_calceolata.AAC.1
MIIEQNHSVESAKQVSQLEAFWSHVESAQQVAYFACSQSHAAALVCNFHQTCSIKSVHAPNSSQLQFCPAYKQVLKLGEKTLIDPLSLRDYFPSGSEAKIDVQLK